MKKSKLALLRWCLYAVCFIHTLPAFANDAGFTISPTIGRHFLDGARSWENGSFWSFGAGYEFEQNWAVELAYLEASPDLKNSSQEVDFELFHMNAFYYIGEQKLKPYLVAGIGDGEYSLGSWSEDDTFAHFGIGLKYTINRNLAIRTDFRALKGTGEEEVDNLLGIGLVYKFVRGGSSSKPTRAKPKVTESKPKDSDGDGVADRDDACPHSKVGAVVDEQGCSDSDNDGVTDNNDLCPDTKVGAKVDNSGCYLTLKEDVSVSLNVNFATNSDSVLEGSDADIQKLASFLREYPNTNAVIEGHTDSLGAAQYNRTLSQRRAEAVLNILVNDYSVERSRLKAIGYGEDRPLVDNSTASNRAKNRRVQAVVSTTVEKTIQ